MQILYKTPKFDHCIFSANPNFSSEKFAEFCEILSTMDYSNPAHKEMMDMKGLKKWVGGRTSEFKQITKANEYLKFFG